MSGNKLLAENTIRRFMKLANVDTMTDNFISEMGVKYKKTDAYGRDPYKKDELEEDVDEITEEEEEEEMELDAAEMGQEEPEEDPDMDMDMDPEIDAEPEMGAADMSLTEEEAQLLIDLGKRLEEAMGAEMDEPAMDEPAMDEPAMDEPAMDEPEAGAEDEEEEPMMQEDLVNEVLKRVTKRLVAAKLKNRK